MTCGSCNVGQRSRVRHSSIGAPPVSITRLDSIIQSLLLRYLLQSIVTIDSSISFTIAFKQLSSIALQSPLLLIVLILYCIVQHTVLSSRLPFVPAVQQHQRRSIGINQSFSYHHHSATMSESKELPFAPPAPKTSMKYRYLGTTGLKVSELCLGAMTFSVTGAGYVSCRTLCKGLTNIGH